MDAGGELTAVDAAFPPAEAIAAVHDSHAPSPTTEDDCDDLYGDVDLGFLPLSPPSHYPTSPPKTPSPGHSAMSPSPPPPPPPPRRGPLPDPTAKAEPEPPKPTPQQQPQPLLPAAKPAPPRASPPTTAVFIGELPYWTTDAEVEGALAPHGALHGLHFFTDKLTGKSRGFCRADFLSPDAAASAAAALHGRTFDGRHCVASLSCPPALLPLGGGGGGDDPHVHAPRAARGRGRGRGGGHGGNSTTARGNVGPPLGDPPALAPPPRPQLPFGGGMLGGGGGAGYGGFAPMIGQCNAAIGTSMMPSVVSPHVNPAFLAASGMAMGGTGMWYDQRMTGMWVGQQPWNFGGYGMPRHQQKPPMQQPNRNGDYGTVRGTAWRGRPAGGRNEGDTGNANGNERGYPDRRQCGRGRDGFDLSRKHGHEERGRYRPRVLEEEREHERNWDESDRYGGDRRRYQEYPERDFERRGRVRSRSSSRDGDDDDHPGRHC
ncbi:formin-like protein 20 [Oryza glaberrima]|uniref:RRM domain-containing protein n=1 Tax=Oryza glaberrima TaxID=4538 RepID=I1PM26_ORYGL|nr:formin-like protein 20 [Oryza glaberrima]